MREFGYIIVKTLVTDITPAQKVRVAMNDIETSKRNRLAATEKADADKVMIVKRAEADAVSKYHQGAGNFLVFWSRSEPWRTSGVRSQQWSQQTTRKLD